MASKPNAALSRWADQLGANLISPTSGERDLGFQAGTPAASGKVNWQINQLYLWALYLSDGALSGNHSIAGSLTIGGQLFAFTDFTFTADNTTDQLAATGNPLDTGYGPVRVSNSGGGLPSGLTAGTDYWWIKVDANHGRLATSLANALSGTFINFTTNGTGTQTLLHQAGTTQVSDETVTRSLTVGGFISQGEQWETLPLAAPGFSPSTTEHFLPAAIVAQPDPTLAPNGYMAQIPSRIGRTITGVRARVADATTNTLAVLLVKSDQNSTIGAAPLIGFNDVSGSQSTASTASGLLEVVSKTGLSEAVIANVNYYVCVRMVTGTGPTGCRVFSLEYKWA